MPPFPDLPEPLSDGDVALRFAAERDIPEVLIAHQDDPELFRRLGLARPPSGAQLGRRMEGDAAERAAGAGVWLTIVAAGSDVCRGMIDVHQVDWDHARAQLGMWMAPAERRRGRGRAALGLAARWLVRESGIMRVELLTEPDNQPMRRCALAAGFTEEGTLRAYLREGRRRTDAVVLSLIAADVPVP